MVQNRYNKEHVFLYNFDVIDYSAKTKEICLSLVNSDLENVLYISQCVLVLEVVGSCHIEYHSPKKDILLDKYMKCFMWSLRCCSLQSKLNDFLTSVIQ